MERRRFGRLGFEVSALGFGCMRLPTTDGTPGSGNIDAPEAIRMIRRAIDEGVSYVDTAYPYHDGRSEAVVGQALADGYRERVKLATKSPVWLIRRPEDFDHYLDEQLRRLGTDRIDCYLLHALNAARWRDTILRHGVLARADAAIQDGRIGHLGFSFHDEGGIFDEILAGYDRWEFCQLQYNYMDTENQAGTRGLKRAAAKGLAVVVMEPLLGGRLARPPAPVREAMARAPVSRTPAEWALQWLWDQPEVSVVLSGMSTMEQVEENLASARRARVGSFGPQDHAVIAEVQRLYRERTPIPCTKCGYCMPCPNGVDIPAAFEAYNDAHLHDDVEAARQRYHLSVGPDARADACIACLTCEEKCPQRIPIHEWMPKVHALLG